MSKIHTHDNTASDEDLGIGQPDAETVRADLAALLANPELQGLIDQAVSARLAQMGAVPAGGGQITGEAFDRLAVSLQRMIENQQMQQPGYIKPMPLEEAERRAAGYVEMTALLRQYQQDGIAPLWRVGENGFFECTNAIEFAEGDEIRTYLPPCEDFMPLNERAEKVHAAMMTWIGGPSPEIGERVKQAQIEAKQAPLISSEPAPVIDPRRTGSVELVNRSVEKPASKKRRDMGTIVTEAVDVSLTGKAPLAAAATIGGAPQGPNFASV